MKQKSKKDWQCFQCGFTGTEKQVEDHKCKGFSTVVDRNGKKHIVR